MKSSVPTIPSSLLALVVVVQVLAIASTFAQRRPGMPQLSPAKYVSVLVGDNCATTVTEVIEMEAALTDVFPITRPLKEDILDYPFDPRDYGMLGVSAESANQRMMITFEDGQGKEWGHVFLDPRLRFADGIHGAHHAHEEAHGEHAVHGKFFTVPQDIDVFHLPIDATHIKVYCRNTTTHVRHALHQRRKFMYQATSGEFRVDARNFVGPNSTQHAVIFVSGGFLSSEEGSFNETVDAILGLLPDPSFSGDPPLQTETQNLKNMHKSVPFDRYWNLFNVYTVFQASPESGASRPKIGLTINNNLDCFHPETMERAVTCSWEKAIALADLAPAPVRAVPDRVLVIVVVNTNIYGGTGMSKRGKVHVGNFYTGIDLDTAGAKLPRDGEKYASLVNHEVGHAFGGLVDEYDIGFTEPTTVEFSNCQAPAANGGPPNPPKWSHWIDIMSQTSLAARYRGEIDATVVQGGQTIQQWDVATTPLPVCLYTNYYRPNEYCMMNRLRDFYMCPVCREASTIEIMLLPFEYQWPRFPLPDNVLIIPTAAAASAAGATGVVTTSTGVVLHLPYFLSTNNGFNVVWRLGNQVLPIITEGQCPQCVRLSPTTLSDTSLFPLDTMVTITASIVDTTNGFISDGKKSAVTMLNQSAVFRIKVTSTMPVEDATQNITEQSPIRDRKGNFGVALPEDGLSTFQQCTSLDPSRPPLCKLDFTVKTYEAPEDLDALLSSYDQWVLYIIGAVALAFFLLWVWAWHYYSNKSRGVVRPIFRTDFTGVVRIIRGIMKVSAVLFMLASMGALGASVYFYTKTSALGKIAIFLGLPLALGLYVMAFIGFWAVAYRSKRLLLINGGVLTFGFLFLIACCAILVSLGKDIQSEDSFWTNQLRTLWADLVKDQPERICAIQGMLGCSGFTYTCDGRSNVVSTVYCPINCEKTNEKFGTSCKQLVQDWVANTYTMVLLILVGCTTMMFFAIVFNFTYYFKLVQMKKEIREANNARVHRHTSQRNINARAADSCRALFILKTLNDGDVESLKKEFIRIDTDGNGQLDRQEFLVFFKKALCYKPSPAEIEKIYEVADIDGDGTISLEEFLAMFRSNPSSGGGAGAALKGGVDSSRAAEIRRRMERAYGKTGLVDDEMGGAAVGNGAHHNAPPPKKAYRPPADRPPTPPGLL